MREKKKEFCGSSVDGRRDAAYIEKCKSLKGNGLRLWIFHMVAGRESPHSAEAVRQLLVRTGLVKLLYKSQIKLTGSGLRGGIHWSVSNLAVVL